MYDTATFGTLAGVVLLFCKWYHIFSRSTATVLTATFVFLLNIAPALAAKEVFGFQANEPTCYCPVSLPAQVRRQRSRAGK